MSGSKMTTQRKAILAAVKKAPPGGDYAWDGKDEDDRAAVPAFMYQFRARIEFHPKFN